MMRATIRRVLVASAIVVVMAGGLRAQEPATVAEAARVLDLASFPMMPGGVAHAPRRLGQLSYAARGDVRGAFAFQKKALEQRGWKELPGGYVSDQSCSGNFAKDGFLISVSVSPGFGPDSAGLVEVMLRNHGNVDTGKLPVPPDAKPLYAFPTTRAYVTEKSVKETSGALRKLLMAQGWEPYGTAGDSQFFKKNAVRLSAWPSEAPAQGGKTVIQLSTELMSADLPAPPAVLDAAYADTTKVLSLVVAMSPEALAAFYKDVLRKAGWQATTEKLIKLDSSELLLFRNDANDIVTLTMQDHQGKLRANVEHRTAAEFAELARQAEAEDAKQKAESAQHAKKAAEAAARGRVTVAIGVPAGARGVKHEKSSLEFKLPVGQARAAVESIRAALQKAGWKAKPDRLDPMAGSVTLEKSTGVTVIIVYVDAGFEDAEVQISAFGAEIEKPAAR